MSRAPARTTSPPPSQHGFTLPELLVVVVVLGLLTGLSFLLMRPKSLLNEQLRTERRFEIAALAQSLERYRTAKGQYPADIPATTTAIGSSDESYDLCLDIVPDYVTDIPLDPLAGAKFKGQVQQAENGAVCNETDVLYSSGYAIAKTNKGITLSAPADKELSVTIH